MKNYEQVLQISEVDGFLDVINWYYNTDSYNIGENNGFSLFQSKKNYGINLVFTISMIAWLVLKIKHVLHGKRINNRLKNNKLYLGLYDYFYNIDIYERKK